MCLTPRFNPPDAKLDLPNSEQLPNSFDNCDYLYWKDCTSINQEDEEFVVVQYNVQGILNKQADICDFLNNCSGKQVHLAIIVETWLKPLNKDRINIPGYCKVF